MIQTVNSMDGAGTLPPLRSPQRRILILNWRDMRHPRAGGAENMTHKMARQWVSWGHRVTQFCAAFPGGAAQETIDGVDIVRRGNQFTVHWEAYRHYARLFRGRYDLIIDEVNTIPFWAPLYAREPVLMYVHQLARNVWRYEAPFPVSIAGYLSEPLYLQPYRHTPIMTISQSTKDDLRRFGLRGPYHFVPQAVDRKAFTLLPVVESKEPELTLLYVGRIVPSKRVHHIVEALGHIHRSGLATARLWLVGWWDERYHHDIDHRIAALGLKDYVTFFGHLDPTVKEDLIARAHVLVMTSIREGWGVVVTEANALGTPAVVYNVPGLRDSTRDGETGVICKRNTPRSLAQAITQLYVSPAVYARIRARAWDIALEASWDRTARTAWSIIEACL